MLRKIRLKNYGPFREAEMALEPLTVLVGPNASGKSTVLELLHGLSTMSVGTAVRFVSRKWRKGSEEETLEIESCFDKGKSEEWKFSYGGEPTPSFKDHPEVLGLFPQTVFPHLVPGALNKPSYIDSEGALIQDDGYGLPTALANLRLTANDEFEAILARTRNIVPSFEGVGFKRARVQRNGKEAVIGEDLVYHMRNAPDLPANLVSDGTLFTLGLLTSAVEYARINADSDKDILFLIDEPEHNLHPRALEELVAQLRKLTEGGKFQVLAASHSPYLVDALRHDEVRIIGFLEDGSSTIRNLSDCPEFDRWKNLMTPGEIWSTVGESWIK